MSAPNQEQPFGSPEGPTDAEIRLQALNHSKDRLLALVGHDVRTAIAGVISLADMLGKRLEDGEVEEAKRLTGLIRRSSHDADDLLRDLVAWTRAHRQEVMFRLEALDVTELARSEVERVQSIAMRKEVSVRMGEGDSGIIRADRAMLQATLRNLLTNAIKFSYPGGEVLVRTLRGPGQWEFEVCDSGIGMPEPLQELILKVDQRKQQPGTAGESGSGFGLMLCEEFVKRHGGHFSWKSAEGLGSTFRFTIPELIG